MTNSGIGYGLNPHDRMRHATPMMALLFALFVFGVLTFYATLNPSRSNPVISDKRIVATMIGAGVYWLTIRAIAFRFGRSSREIVVATLGVGIPGALLILAVRTLYDVMTLDDLAGSFELNLRWVLLWLGYFGAWVAGFFALVSYRGMKVAQAEAKCATNAVAQVRAAAPVQPAAVEHDAVNRDAFDFVLTALAEEMAQQPRADRVALARALLSRSGYEQADCVADATAANARLHLTRRLVARLAA